VPDPNQPQCLGSLPSGYQLRKGSTLDRALLLKCLRHTYREIVDEGWANGAAPTHITVNADHLAYTVEQYLSRDTPLWWIEFTPPNQSPVTVGGVWAGNAVDQISGDRHAHIFLLYVTPKHRRQGLGRYLLQVVETWAKQRGDRQISLQSFSANQPALALYHSSGFTSQSVLLHKPL
jgi:ribosomal protein S18 acetylase RimI-like enzyme